jgi:hypothetical protein
MRKYKVKFYLKSGRTVTVKCKNADIRSEGGEISGWSLSGINKRINATVDSVEAVTVKQRW